MRVRMVRRPSGIIDGVSLSAFIPGLRYDVSRSLGHYLVAQRFAEELVDTAPVLIVALDTPPSLYSPFQGGVHIEQTGNGRDTGDRKPKRSTKRR
jgi:hypothetical protein